MKKCLNCGVCPYIREGKSVISTSNNHKVDIKCNSSHVNYLVGCVRCRKQNKGETDGTLKERFREHRGYVTAKMENKATGKHFNKPGHSVNDMTVTVIEKIFNNDRGRKCGSTSSTQDTRA